MISPLRRSLSTGPVKVAVFAVTAHVYGAHCSMASTLLSDVSSRPVNDEKTEEFTEELPFDAAGIIDVDVDADATGLVSNGCARPRASSMSLKPFKICFVISFLSSSV